MGRESECLPKKTYGCQKTRENILNITSHKGNANQSHNKIWPHTCQNGYYQKDNKWQILARMWRKGNPCALQVGMETGTANMENSIWETVYENFKIELPWNLVIPLQGIFLKKTKTLIWKDKSTPMFSEALLTIVEIWKQPKCSPIDEWINKMWGIFTGV